MEKFYSQICTTREQSKRLIALGLKPETADMLHSTIEVLGNMVDLISAHVWTPKAHVTDDWFPAWSLHRLIEILDKSKIFICSFVPIDANRCYEDMIVLIADAIGSNRLKHDYWEEKQ